nr:MAG TPA: hypothetical protein [Caudoviricetes sp.]
MGQIVMNNLATVFIIGWFVYIILFTISCVRK